MNIGAFACSYFLPATYVYISLPWHIHMKFPLLENTLEMQKLWDGKLPLGSNRHQNFRL